MLEFYIINGINIYIDYVIKNIVLLNYPHLLEFSYGIFI